MLTLTCTPSGSDRAVRMPVAVAQTRLGGWAVIGWQGAAPAELLEQVRLLADDGDGAARLATIEVMMPVTEPR